MNHNLYCVKDDRGEINYNYPNVRSLDKNISVDVCHCFNV